MECRVCNGTSTELTITLGEQPWGNDFLLKEEVGKERFYPLEVFFCNDCKTSQLGHTVPKEVMFSNHTYLSGMTKMLQDHFHRLAEKVLTLFEDITEPISVLDIGSNDGTQLKCYKELGCEVLGVESSDNIAKIANQKGIPTKSAFFDEELVKGLNQKFDVINASGVFFHLEELHSVTRGIKAALKEDGVFVVQFIYLKKMIENFAFDQIYHEHLLYYNISSLRHLLAGHGLEIWHAFEESIHGGSIVAYVSHPGRRGISDNLKRLLIEEEEGGFNRKDTYTDFAKKLEGIKEDNIQFLTKCKEQGKKVYGLGAPVKGNTLLNYFEIDNNLISQLIEINPLRAGMFAPGSHIPIIMEDELIEAPDVYYVLAWNFKNEILTRHERDIRNGVEFFFPIETD